MKREVTPFDHHDPQFRLGKWEVYEDLRGQCPVAWSAAHGGFWTLASYDDVVAVARDDGTFSSAREVVIPPTGVGRIIPLNADPPDLERYRHSLGPFFTRPYVETLEPDIRRFTIECLDRVAPLGRCDFVSDLANPVPSMTLMRMLGLPPEDWAAYTLPVQSHSYSRGEERASAHGGIDWVAGRMREEAERRRREPGDDLITHLVRLEADGVIDAEERHDLIMMSIFGGLETTMAAMAHSVLYFGRHPDQRRWLAANPAAIPAAVDEILRWEPPVQGFARTVTRDVEIDGCPIRAGETVFMLWASANRDPAVFEAPDEVRLDRSPNPHLTFGMGKHRCLGAILARAELRIMHEELLRRIPDWEVDEDAAVYPQTIAVVNGIVSLPGTFPPA